MSKIEKMRFALLAGLLGFILGFNFCLFAADWSIKRSAERGYIGIEDTTYKLVPMDKGAERNDN